MNEHAHEAAGAPSLVSDYLALLKLRIASFVGLSAFVGGLLGAGPEVPVVHILEASVWITLAAGAASVFNQIYERDTDRLMVRTRNRPLPAGRIAPREAMVYASVIAVVSIAALALRFNALSAVLAFTTLVSYVALYTPLKRVSTLNTVVGAFPGAAPPLLGYAALAGGVGVWAWALFAIVYVWQFPHFMSIAWLYREDYARAGLRMLPSARGGERVAGRAAMTYSLILVPVSLFPAMWGHAGLVFTIGAVALGVAYVAASLRFAWRQDRGSARVLLFTSLAYLPLVLALVLLDPRTGVVAAHWAR
jgi:heme o synthase